LKNHLEQTGTQEHKTQPRENGKPAVNEPACQQAVELGQPWIIEKHGQRFGVVAKVPLQSIRSGEDNHAGDKQPAYSEVPGQKSNWYAQADEVENIDGREGKEAPSPYVDKCTNQDNPSTASAIIG
jgi:hypothetical protein